MGVALKTRCLSTVGHAKHALDKGNKHSDDDDDVDDDDNKDGDDGV